MKSHRHLVPKLIAMPKTIFFFACCALLLCQCRSLRSTDFRSTPALPERLPPLRLLVHQSSFFQAFNSADVAWSNETDDPAYVYAMTGGAMQDVSYFLQNELMDNVMQGGSTQAGQARFKLLFYHRSNPGWGFTIPSILSLFTLNIAGMPAGTVQCEMDLQLEIADTRGNQIITYRAPGEGKAKVALYYGYTTADAVRKANLEALKSALKAIEIQIQADVPALTAQLAAPDQ